MQTVFSSTGTTLQHFDLTAEMHESIGRVVRAFAEIDSLLMMHISQMSRSSMKTVAVMLDRASLGKKIEIALMLADEIGGECAKATREAFDSDAMRDCRAFRNTVAHGQLLGLSETGTVVFLMDKLITERENSRIGAQAEGYDPSIFPTFARLSEAIPAVLVKTLRLGAQVEERRRQALYPHPKSQPKKRLTDSPAD